MSSRASVRREQKAKLTERELQIISSLREQGDKWKKIACAINRSESTVRQAYKLKEASKHLPPPLRRSRFKFPAKAGLFLLRLIRDDQKQSLSTLHFKLKERLKEGTYCPSRSSIYRYLNRKGIKSRKLKKVPFIRPRHECLRMAFAMQMIYVCYY
jgi:IS30 family transposase